jgi:signal transduction histidine kinase
VRHLVRLVDDLLDVSRISTGKLLLKRETVELKSVVATALETVDALFKMRQHELTVDLPNEPVFVNADPTRLSQVMINLLNNAAKYTAPRGEIRLRAAVAGHELSIDVSDNGVGLDGEAMQRIFDMFHQVDASLDREQAGLGVGLTLARSLVELHGGTISAESAGAGLGSTFQVRLPIVVPSAVKDAA